MNLSSYLVEWEGQVFPSVSSAARKSGLNIQTLHRIIERAINRESRDKQQVTYEDKNGNSYTFFVTRIKFSND